MKCLNSKRFCLSFLVLLFLSSALFSEVCFTDEEAEELDQHLTALETIVTTQGLQLAEQKILLTTSSQEIVLLNASLKEAEISWRKQKLALIIQGGSLGLIVGVTLFLILNAVLEIDPLPP